MSLCTSIFFYWKDIYGFTNNLQLIDLNNDQFCRVLMNTTPNVYIHPIFIPKSFENF